MSLALLVALAAAPVPAPQQAVAPPAVQGAQTAHGAHRRVARRGIAPLRQPVAPERSTSPPRGDTTGYWQQRLRYTIAATLDERAGVLRATGTLVYVNRSPDTLRELYVQQYLNAFRPGSRWSATDSAEGRTRFQGLRDPDYGYERFTAPARVDGEPVRAEYPGAPDSTVARFRLPRPLVPNDSVRVVLAWEARPSTVPRRQARRGRSFDFAQWYPKPAVYDRGGWEAHAFVPAGELYGEFGDYDVTLVLRDDQVVGATGVVVAGNPGYEVPARERAAYGAVEPGPTPDVPPRYKAVRFVARDVHHFAFSLSPDYRQEAGTYVRGSAPASGRARSWDTVSIHALYRPADEAEWGRGLVVERTRRALAWLESRYGAYAYPQMTVLHRIDGGGTEFPMMQMNGSPSQGLILHEGGHVFSYGILANNEWRSGWMDEGLTQYQSEWAQGLTRPERGAGLVPLATVAGFAGAAPSTSARAAAFGATVNAARPAGYAGLARRPAASEEGALAQYALDLAGRAQPIGLQSEYFRDFGTYNSMIYTRAAMMYGALRDVLGDSTFTAFLHTYYARWALRHVDETAMRSSAESVSGRDLGWFFDQWVHHTGLIDYSIDRVRVSRDGEAWVTHARVHRRGAYRHPMPVGAHTAAGWTLVRADPLRDVQDVEIRTPERPSEVRLDPQHVTEDWYRPNDAWVASRGWIRGVATPLARSTTIDWPFLEQASADRYVNALRPMAWTSAPNGALLGLRLRQNYQGVADLGEAGLVFGTREGTAERGSHFARRDGRVQWWATGENVRLGGRTLYGAGYGLWNLDGISKVDLHRAWDLSPFTFSAGVHETTTVAFTGTYPYSRGLRDPVRWSGGSVSELRATFARHTPGLVSWGTSASIGAGLVAGHVEDPALTHVGHRYVRGELALTRTERSVEGRATTFARLYAGYAPHAPQERALYASADDPTSTFANHFWRPRGGLLAPPTLEADGSDGAFRTRHTLGDGHYRPLGGAALHGYDPRVALGTVAALNVERAVRVLRALPFARTLAVHASLFADVAVVGADARAVPGNILGDAGPALLVRGRLFDQPVRARLDFPLYVRTPTLAVGDGAGRPTRVRIAFSANDLW